MEYSQLIHIGTYGFHTLHNAFSHSAKALLWKLKELLNAMYKLFDEFPYRLTDYKTLISTTEKDYVLKFFSYRWIENESIARKA